MSGDRTAGYQGNVEGTRFMWVVTFGHFSSPGMGWDKTQTFIYNCVSTSGSDQVESAFLPGVCWQTSNKKLSQGGKKSPSV